MELINNLAYGFSVALTLENLLFCFIGVSFGTFIGVLPGIGAFAALGMLLPLSFQLPPAAGIIMLAGFYYGALYGGSTASILLNVPGTPSSAITCLEGYPMAQKGRAGVALTMTALASFVGGTFSFILIAAVSEPLARVAMSFGAPEYASMILLGLLICSSLNAGQMFQGTAMMAFGLILGVAGIDSVTGDARFTFGQVSLFDGLNLVALAMGLFGIAEIAFKLMDRESMDAKPMKVRFRDLMPTWQDLKISALPSLRGSAVGAAFGVLPGTGAAISSFVSYALEKAVARDRHTFGTGRLEGLVSPEAANNSAAQSAFIPTLSLGIPGDAIMVLILAALMIHGVQPGPQMIIRNPDVFWGLIASFWIGNLMLLILNIPLVGLWVRLLQIPYRLMYPAIIVFISLGVYSVRSSAFDLLFLAGISLFTYIMRMFRLSPVPLILGVVLGAMLEQNFRRALMISRGDLMIFLERPVSLLFLVISFLIVVVYPLALYLWRLRKSRQLQWER